MSSRSVAATLAVATFLASIFAVATAVAHEPEEDAVDPLLRPLYLIYQEDTSARDDPRNASYQSSYEMRDLGYRLSLANNTTTQASRGFSFRENPASVVCVYPSTCTPYYARAGAHHAGEDIQIEPAETFEGALRLAWSHSGSQIASSSQYYGWVSISLQVGEEFYYAESIPLRGTRGDATFQLNFVRDTHRCEEARGHHGREFKCALNETAEVWTHDVKLGIQVYHQRDPIFRPFGSQLSVKFDTAGGSFLNVHEVPPPPTPVEPVEVSSAEADDVPIAASYDDVDGDGEVDPEELHFVPTVSPVLVLAALGGLGLAVRRFRK